MANWWDAAPLAEPAQPAAQPAAGANWWDAAPLANEAAPTRPAPQIIPGQGGAPTRVVMDVSGAAVPVASSPPEVGATQRGMGETFARSAAQSAAFNFGDELAGVRNAAPQIHIPGTDIDLNIPDFVGPIPARTLAGGARLAAEYFSPQQRTLTDVVADRQAAAPAYADYERGRNEFRTAIKEGEEQNPATAIAGGVTGALASAVLPGGVVTLPGKAFGLAEAGINLTAKEIARRELAKRVAESTATGVATGGASGVGEGENAGDRASKGLIGSTVGGVLGVAGNALIEGVGAAGRGISKAAQPIIQNWRGATNVDAEAARRILQRQQSDAATAAPGLTRAEFDAAKASGSPVINADMGGEATQALARSAANTSPEGRAALQTVTGERYATQSPRLAGWLKDTFDFPAPGPALERLQEAARRENRPAYIKAYSEGASLPFDDGLAQISQAPVVQDAIRKAMVTAKNEAAKLDLPAPKIPFEFDVNGRVQLKSNPDGSSMTPNLQFWDIVKRNLDKTGTPEARDWARVLREHLDDFVPSYNTARSGAAKFFGAEEALEAGAKFATMSGRDAMSIGEARKALSQLTASDRKLFEAGFVSNLIAKIEDLKDGQDVVKQIFNSEFAKKQINLVLGPEKAAQLEAKLLAERAMNGIKNAVQGNSTTTRQWIEAGAAGGVGTFGGYGIYDMDPQKIGTAALTGAILAGGRKIDQRVARRVAEMLASDDPKILDAGIKMVANSSVLRDVLLKLNLPAARVGGQQAGNFPAIQAGGAVRADEQQQQVPGPVR